MRKLFMVCVVVSFFTMAMFSIIPAKATAGPTVTHSAQNTCNTCVSGTNALTVDATTDNIFVIVQLIGSQTVSGITDNKGGTYYALYSKVFTPTNDGSYTTADLEIWSGNPGSTGATTITVSFSASTSAGIESLDANGFNSGNLAFTCVQFGVSASGTNKFTSGSCPFNPAFQIAIASDVNGGGQQTAGTGYTGVLAAGNACNSTCSTEYSTSVTAVNPTNFPYTATGSGGHIEIGLVIQAIGTATTISQTQVLGTCAKNTATFTMANSTLYFYSGNALGQQVVNTAQVNVAQVTGSVARKLQILLYVSSGQQATVATPLVRVWNHTYTITAGTTNQQLISLVNIPLNSAVASPLPFNLWAVAVVGDSHIKLNQSSIAGITTQTGAVPNNNQPASFTNIGTSVATQLAVCTVSAFQSVLQGPTTTVASGTITSTVSTTSTSTLTSLGGVNPTIFNNSNFMLAIIVILGPALMMAGVTKSLMGGVFGGLLGVAVGVFIGFVPFYMIVAIVLFSVVVLFVGRGQGGGNI